MCTAVPYRDKTDIYMLCSYLRVGIKKMRTYKQRYIYVLVNYYFSWSWSWSIDLGKFWNIDDFMGNSAIFWTIFLVIWYQLAHREVICYLIDLLWLGMLWPFQWYIFLLYTSFNIVKEISEVEGGLRNFECQIWSFSKKMCIRAVKERFE